jgi:hypothetical protein
MAEVSRDKDQEILSANNEDSVVLNNHLSNSSLKRKALDTSVATNVEQQSSAVKRCRIEE